MIDSLRIIQVLPRVFSGQMPDGNPSEVWLREVVLEKGQSYLIEAASGRGKSSLCAYLYGLRHDYDGTIQWMNDTQALNLRNEDIATQLKQKGIAMMFQELRLFPELTTVENILLKNRLTNFSSEADIRGKLQALGLGERLDTPCSRLSIGQQQRVAFVRMLCQPADFCLLDEPVSHLDEANAQTMSAMLHEYQQHTGCGILVTSIGHHLPYRYDIFKKL